MVDALLALPERNRFMKGLYAWVGFKAVRRALPARPRARRAAATSAAWRLLRLSLDGLTAFTTWPLRAVSLDGLRAGACSASPTAPTSRPSYLLYGNTVSRLDHHRREPDAVLPGIQMISLGIVGEYVGRIFEEVKARPLFVVKRDWGQGLEDSRAGDAAVRRRGARQPVAVAAADPCLAGATAWLRPLTLPDEGRYVGVAWEMLRSGDWLTPTLDGLPFFHKPPLFYWITAASLSPVRAATTGPAAPRRCSAAWLGAFVAVPVRPPLVRASAPPALALRGAADAAAVLRRRPVRQPRHAGGRLHHRHDRWRWRMRR